MKICGKCIEALILDLSGTLLDDWNEVYETSRLVAANRGIDLTKEFYRRFYKLDWKEFWVSLNIPCDTKLIQEWLTINEQLIYKKTTPLFYTEAIEFINKAKGKYKIAVVTNAVRQTFNLYITLASLSQDYFDTVVTGEETSARKPAPDHVLIACKRLKVKPERAIMIGDTEEDIIAGKLAGCITVKVGWGYPLIKCYIEEKADFVVFSWEELQNLVL